MAHAERLLWTAADVAALPDDGYRCDLIKGRLIREPLAGANHGETSGDLGTELGLYARIHNGHYYGAETGFNLTLLSETEETVLGPDAAYIGDEVVPTDPHGFVGRPPDLAVEVASPSQFRPEMEDKARLWLARGCHMIWLVWPKHKTIEVWYPGDIHPRHTLGPGDELTGGDILPGFHYPVVQAFK